MSDGIESQSSAGVKTSKVCQGEARRAPVSTVPATGKQKIMGLLLCEAEALWTKDVRYLRHITEVLSTSFTFIFTGEGCPLAPKVHEPNC